MDFWSGIFWQEPVGFNSNIRVEISEHPLQTLRRLIVKQEREFRVVTTRRCQFQVKRRHRCVALAESADLSEIRRSCLVLG